MKAALRALDNLIAASERARQRAKSHLAFGEAMAKGNRAVRARNELLGLSNER